MTKALQWLLLILGAVGAVVAVVLAIRKPASPQVVERVVQQASPAQSQPQGYTDPTAQKFMAGAALLNSGVSAFGAVSQYL